MRASLPAPHRRVVRPRVALLLGAVSLAAAGGCRNPTEPGVRVRTYEVAPTRAPCVGLFPTECLRVRVLPDTAWRLFHGGIAGFVHEPGYAYVLRVAERPVPDPPADGSSVAYRLVGVVSKSRVER